MITPRGIDVESAVYNAVEFNHAELHRVIGKYLGGGVGSNGTDIWPTNIRQTADGIDPAR